MSTLTRTEAARRADLLRVLSYDVRLEFTGDERAFRSKTTITFRCARPGEATFVNVQPVSLTQATLNGAALDPSTLAGGRLPLSGLRADNELVIDAVMAYSHDGEGLHRHVDPADGRTYLYATSALAAGPRWFACFDQPDLKAPVRLRVRCPPAWTVAANGAAVQQAPGDWVFEPTPPMPTYLATVVAGEYQTITGEHDDIPLALHARTSLSAQLERDADELLAYTGRCLDEFHRLFGIRYPWGAYHQAFVPEFNWGAMENPGCVTLRDEMLFRGRATEADRAGRASTIAHEMAHMWFGDLVTMRWWDDLWLNESFAEYLGHRVCGAVSQFDTWTHFGITRKPWGYAADRRPSAHPVAGNGVADVDSALGDFDGISYAKGACVLRQLATALGDPAFLAGLRSYFAAHAYGNAELADLLRAWSDTGALDVPGWAAQWLRTPGLDTISVSRPASGVHLHRRSPAEYPAARRHALRVASYDSGGNDLDHALITVDADTTDVPGIGADAALVLPDADDQTWAKIELDAATWDRLPPLLPRLPAPARVVIANALRLAIADAQLAPEPALRAALVLLRTATDQAVLAALAQWVTVTFAETFVAPGPRREQALHEVADTAMALLAESPLGSGAQLAAARAYLRASTDAARLRAWLDGEAPAGVEVDAELRWAIAERLCTLGAMHGEDIERELARDSSTQGGTHAARCRALLPSAPAKARTWQLLVHDPRASNYELYASAEGFWQPGQEALTAGYVTRYFDEIAATAQFRSGWVVGRVALRAFPVTAVAHDTVQRAAALLANPDLHPGIRRSVVDAADDLRRVLAYRSRFGAQLG